MSKDAVDVISPERVSLAADGLNRARRRILWQSRAASWSPSTCWSNSLRSSWRPPCLRCQHPRSFLGVTFTPASQRSPPPPAPEDDVGMRGTAQGHQQGRFSHLFMQLFINERTVIKRGVGGLGGLGGICGQGGGRSGSLDLEVWSHRGLSTLLNLIFFCVSHFPQHLSVPECLHHEPQPQSSEA